MNSAITLKWQNVFHSHTYVEEKSNNVCDILFFFFGFFFGTYWKHLNDNTNPVFCMDHETEKDRESKATNTAEWDTDRNEWKGSETVCVYVWNIRSLSVEVETVECCWSCRCFSFLFNILHTWLLIRGQNVMKSHFEINVSTLRRYFIWFLIFVLCVIFFFFFIYSFSTLISTSLLKFNLSFSTKRKKKNIT